MIRNVSMDAAFAPGDSLRAELFFHGKLSSRVSGLLSNRTEVTQSRRTLFDEDEQGRLLSGLEADGAN